MNQGGFKSNAALPPKWLGLEIDHRWLFEADQDGWLHPKSAGFVLGREFFAAEPNRINDPNVVSIRVVVDEEKLPRFGKESTRQIPERNFPNVRNRKLGGLEWLAPIPLYAVVKLEVKSPQEKARIRAMSKQFSNVSLPDAEFVVGSSESLPVPMEPTESNEAHLIELPNRLDAVQGAMAMAIWGVPHIESWIEALRHALSLDAESTSRKMWDLDAPWLRFPWLLEQMPCSQEFDTKLWEAAVTFQYKNVRSPNKLVESIAQQFEDDNTCGEVQRWAQKTERLLSAKESFGPIISEAGLAIQLVLLRADPTDFRTWSVDLPALSPATLWAGAMLCGWRHGYRALDNHFRGTANLREFLTTRALVASWISKGKELLPKEQREPLRSMHEPGCYQLSWRKRPILRKRWKSRAKWSVANFASNSVEQAAKEVARQFGRNCLKRTLLLRDCVMPTSGDGQLSIDKNQQLTVSHSVELALPSEAQVIETFDCDEFRRELASKTGVVPDPPEESEAKLEDIPGLVYKANFISRDDELELVRRIDEGEWDAPLARRVQHYGWRYDYKQRQVHPSLYLGLLPDWAAKLSRRLVDEGFVDDLPDQLIVNEYLRDQGIGQHTDNPNSFAEQVVTISLLETWGMVFRLPGSKIRIEKELERGSIAVLTGDSRYKWTHEIPKRKYERVGVEGSRLLRGRRISLTFRKTRLADPGLFV